MTTALGIRKYVHSSFVLISWPCSVWLIFTDSVSRHFETFRWHSWWRRRCYLHVLHSNVFTKQNHPLAVQELSSVPYRECKHSGMFLRCTYGAKFDRRAHKWPLCCDKTLFRQCYISDRLVLLHFLSLNGCGLCNIRFRVNVVKDNPPPTRLISECCCQTSGQRLWHPAPT